MSILASTIMFKHVRHETCHLLFMYWGQKFAPEQQSGASQVPAEDSIKQPSPVADPESEPAASVAAAAVREVCLPPSQS